jgi:predicted RNA-binding Zn-ribbon protein involved in translation (DUF1610 family)
MGDVIGKIIAHDKPPLPPNGRAIETGCSADCLRHLNGSINFALTRVAGKAQGEGVAMTSFIRRLPFPSTPFAINLPRLRSTFLFTLRFATDGCENGMNKKVLYNCPNCRADLIAASLSRYINERCVTNFWSCEACGYEHETTVRFSGVNRQPMN